jgi:surfeit locus 1 family protein
MRLGTVAFKPGLIPSIVVLLVLPLLITLGFWQLDRARQKERLQSVFEQHSLMPPAPLAEIDLSDASARYRRVTATGRYDGQRQILLDNQMLDGKPGYHVFTPLLRAPAQPAILVNRGWVPLGESRQALPDISAPNSELTLDGRLAQPANPGLRLGTDVLSPAVPWPRVVQYLDYDQLSAALGYALMPAVILLDADAPGGYARQWRARVTELGPERHRGYAVQWFALATALVVIYVAVNLRRRGTEPSSHNLP